MSNSKIYPVNEPEKKLRNGNYSKIYKGCAKAILTSDDIALIEYAMDLLSFPNENADEVVDILTYVREQGIARMQALHGVLGAYDIDKDLNLTKPVSEKIVFKEDVGDGVVVPLRKDKD